MGPPTTTDRSMHAGHGSGEEGGGREGGPTDGRTAKAGRRERGGEEEEEEEARPTTACMRPVSELTWMGREKARAKGGRGEARLGQGELCICSATVLAWA